MNLAEAEAFLEGRVTAAKQLQAALEAARADTIRECLFDKELALADDPHQFITACCGRRAGKTYTVATMMLRTARKHPRFTVLYLHLTRDGAKGIIWPTLKELNERFGFGGVPNETDLTMTMPNGAVIALRGVDKRKEIEKRRGYGFSLVVLDECQSIPDYVRALVDEVIGPALADVPGRLVMIGTPSLLASGYWHECHHNGNRDAKGELVWAHYSWTMWDNPHMPDPDRSYAAECARRGVPPDDVSMLREWRGLWVRDTSSAVFTFDPARNTYRGGLPKELGGRPLDPTLWRYVVAVDLGGGVKRDNDAVTVFAFHQHARATWLLEEHVDATQDVTALALLVKGIVERLGRHNVVAVPVDTGGIGAKVAKEMRERHKLPTEAAKKADKWANIALLNAACNHGEFYAPEGSKFAAEAVKVEKDWDKSSPDRITIKGHMPDVCDSVLYGYVESYAWTSKAPPKTPEEERAELAAAIAKGRTPPSAEQLRQQQAKEMADYAREQRKRQREQERLEDTGGLGGGLPGRGGGFGGGWGWG